MKNRLSRVALLLTGAVLLLAGSQAQADTVRVTANTDYWFTFDAPTQFIVRTYAVQGYFSDPHLWFYDASGQLIAANDDWYGLQSYLSVQVQPGMYRLRAGVCCGDPNRWWNGLQYDLESSQLLVTTTSGEPTTTSTILPSTTTTETPTTTTSTTTSTTSTTSTTTTVPPTTTTLPATTTTVQQSTTVPSTTVVRETVPTTLVPTTVAVPTTTTSSTSTTTTSSTSTTTTTVAQTTTTTVPIPPTVTPEQATALATNPAVLAAATEEQATEIFQALDLYTLDEDQLVELVAAVQDAPSAVRAAFEEEIDIFSGATDTYVPLGSTVPVSTRRALIVITTVAAVVAVATRRKW